jgi:hypothetical protein
MENIFFLNIKFSNLIVKIAKDLFLNNHSLQMETILIQIDNGLYQPQIDQKIQ